MGLDAVEIVLRTEEVFNIAVSDSEAGSIQTVRDFYIVICDKLGLIALTSPVTSAALPKITQKDRQFWFVYKHTPLPPPPEVLPWTPQTVWDTVVAIFVDQMSLAPEDITPDARINRDLKID
jgi:acyl carrier protein